MFCCKKKVDKDLKVDDQKKSSSMYDYFCSQWGIYDDFFTICGQGYSDTLTAWENIESWPIGVTCKLVADSFDNNIKLKLTYTSWQEAWENTWDTLESEIEKNMGSIVWAKIKPSIWTTDENSGLKKLMTDMYKRAVQ